MSETRKLTTILVADVAAYSRLTAADEEGTAARLRALGHELIDPVIAANKGRLVKTTGDGRLIEFGSVVDAVRCAIELQRKMAVRNADVTAEKRIEFRVGIHLGDVIVERDGDLIGDGVNIAARLEGICEPGGICLSSAAYDQVRDRVAADFTELGERQLKNIARRVRAYAVPKPSDRDRVTLTGGKPNAPSNEGPPHLSIVVLPFANIGGDSEQEYFVDGVTESLTTDMSRIRNSVVIGRHTAFTYKGKSADLRQIGRELNVRYVLEGSIQRSGNRIRINVQLIDAESGAHLWADRFDRDYGDLFEMQDEIVSRLANSLNAQFIAAEARRAERAVNLDAMDYYFRAQATINRGFNHANVAEARALFEQSLTLDPANADAMIGLASLLGIAAGNNFGGDQNAALVAAAEEMADRAHAIAPDSAAVHSALGIIYASSNRTAAAIAEGERAVQLDPNNVMGRLAISVAKLFGGRSEEVEAHIEQLLRLSPRDVFLYAWCAVAGSAKFLLGRDEEALVWLRRSIEANSVYPAARNVMAATLAMLGRLEEAQQEAKIMLALSPNTTIRRYLSAARTDNPTYLAQRQRVVEGLRRAGIPEE